MNTTIAGLAIPDSDLCHVQWRSLAWILEHGPLNESNAIDYFALSPFYDRKSTNQVLRMQSMFSGQPKMDPASEQEALRRFVGIEYALVLSRPEPDREGGLFVIEKRDRKSYDEYHPIASYYILKTSIYQAPSLYSTLSARVLTSLSALKELLELARQHKPIYDPRQSYAWKIKEKPESTATTSDTLDKPTGVQPLTESSKEAEPTSTHQESDEKMDIDMTAPEGNDDESPTKTTDTKKGSKDTPELTNPILFRAFQNTINNFAGFKPPKTINNPVPEKLTIVTSSAPSPANPTQLSGLSSAGSNDPPPGSALPTSSTQSSTQPPARLDSSQDGLIKSGSVAGKTPAKSGGTGTGNKKQKRAA
ncbi:hypothetical protein PSTG_02830 [Puccinia striiformis f. sp. tritici PST-78]|uniref:Mediator of RNA polymerase II transcription subunit 6 n=1 Tax=Puccinia striiformis f. sp. tritici PST-78 TaxID=1165861 RepID=A0A0L0VXY7_9BASI|nr:hypothetical protein PSTG_02830 [Puccinia striiformis f. sp. tritici PST-78]